jgi:hypothetical protein
VRDEEQADSPIDEVVALLCHVAPTTRALAEAFHRLALPAASSATSTEQQQQQQQQQQQSSSTRVAA